MRLRESGLAQARYRRMFFSVSGKYISSTHLNRVDPVVERVNCLKLSADTKRKYKFFRYATQDKSIRIPFLISASAAVYVRFQRRAVAHM